MHKKVILRADGGSKIGFGHVYRLLALAQMLKGKFKLAFISKALPIHIIEELYEVCEQVEILVDEISEAEELNVLRKIIIGGDIVVLDGYQFDIDYQNEIRNLNAKLVYIDDFANKPISADAIINHAPGILPEIYKHISECNLLGLGLDYSLIRPDFFSERLDKLPESISKSIFISFGGADPFNITTRVVKAILNHPKVKKLHVLVTNSFDAGELDKLNDFKVRYRNKINIYSNLKAAELANLFHICASAIVPASTIALELIASGIKPIVGYYIDNQLNLYNGLIDSSLAIGLGDYRDEIFLEILEEFLSDRITMVHDKVFDSRPNLLHLFKNLISNYN